MSIPPLYFPIKKKTSNSLIIFNFRRSAETKRIIKKYQIADDFSNEDFQDQDNEIPSLEISRESEVLKHLFKNIDLGSNLNLIWISRNLKL